MYLNGSEPLHQDPGNLFALRWDLHLGQFDQGRFVIVPKSGQLVVHFLQPTNQSAQRYHNVQFNHKNSLSHELLYARFAWALMNIVTKASLNSNMFNFLEDVGGGGGGGGKRKRDENEEQDGHNTFTFGPSGNLRSSKHVTSAACPREGKI